MEHSIQNDVSFFISEGALEFPNFLMFVSFEIVFILTNSTDIGEIP